MQPGEPQGECPDHFWKLIFSIQFLAVERIFK
jgi:hypothetical protein